MGWVTLDDGQHIWIGPKGNIEPRSPGSKSEAAAIHKAARQPKNIPAAKAHTFEVTSCEWRVASNSDRILSPLATHHSQCGAFHAA